MDAINHASPQGVVPDVEAVVGEVEDVGVVQLAQGLQLFDCGVQSAEFRVQDQRGSGTKGPPPKPYMFFLASSLQRLSNEALEKARPLTDCLKHFVDGAQAPQALHVQVAHGLQPPLVIHGALVDGRSLGNAQEVGRLEQRQLQERAARGWRGQLRGKRGLPRMHS